MKTITFTKKKLHKIGRIDNLVRDYFIANGSVNEVKATKLMPLFIKECIFLSDPDHGLYIRKLLKELDAADKLSLFKHVGVRKDWNRNWYFTRK